MENKLKPKVSELKDNNSERAGPFSYVGVMITHNDNENEETTRKLTKGNRCVGRLSHFFSQI